MVLPAQGFSLNLHRIRDTTIIIISKKKKKKKQQWPVTFDKNSCRVSSGVVLGGNLGFDSRVQSIKNIIADTAEEASVTLKKVAENTGVFKNITQLYDDLGSTSSLDATLQKLNDEVDSTKGAALKRTRMVNKGIKTLWEPRKMRKISQHNLANHHYIVATIFFAGNWW